MIEVLVFASDGWVSQRTEHWPDTFVRRSLAGGGVRMKLFPGGPEKLFDCFVMMDQL